jgi:hypothetical protein
VVHNQLSHIFREKKWSYAKSELDFLQRSYEQKQDLLYWSRGLRTAPINEHDFFSATKLYQAFRQRSDKDYKIRVENSYLQIYANDKAWLLTLSKLTTKPLELWTPSTEHLALLSSNIIIKNKPFPYEYKVSLQNKVDPSFAIWIKNNKDKIKIGSKLLEYIDQGSWVKGMYFYIRDDKILQLVNLMIGSSIQRIDKIVSTANIDK